MENESALPQSAIPNKSALPQSAIPNKSALPQSAIPNKSALRNPQSAMMTVAKVREQIAAGATDPIYLLQGEDDLEKSGLAAEFAEIVEDGLRAFNVERIHAGDMTTGDKIAD